VADAEKLEEEHLLRLENEARRAAVVQQRTQAAKQEIILRALQVFHGLLVRCAHTRLSSYHIVSSIGCGLLVLVKKIYA
jgi:hypothetical protein